MAEVHECLRVGCDAVFTIKRIWEAHHMLHHMEHEEAVSMMCTTCSKRQGHSRYYNRASTLFMHKLRAQDGVHRTACERTLADLSAEAGNGADVPHTDQPAPLAAAADGVVYFKQCQRAGCDERLASMEHMNVHLLIKHVPHGEVATFTCSLCQGGQVYRSVKKLLKHKDDEHAQWAAAPFVTLLDLHVRESVAEADRRAEAAAAQAAAAQAAAAQAHGDQP